MEEIIGCFISFIGIGYSLLLIFSFKNWTAKFKTEDVLHLDYEPKVSIVIAFRNETKVLQQLIESLKSQDYSNFEVILINDHSTDGSLEILKDVSWERMTVYDQEKGKNGKKYALELGVDKSEGELLLFTDADCVFPENWVSSMVYGLQRENADWYAGPIKYELANARLSSFFQALESAYLMMISSWTIVKNIPTTCNGANILMKKSTFLEVDGFEGIRNTPSGDDELFMQKLRKSGTFTLSYSFRQDSIVTTKPALTWSELLNQRFRWASKLKNNSLPFNFILAVLVFSFHLAYMSAFFMNWKLGLILLVVRFLLEIWGGFQAFKLFKLKFKIDYFLISFFVYPLYVIFMSVATQVARFSWKGREY